MNLTDSVRCVPGIGPQKAALLENMGIKTLASALEAYPRGYEDHTQIVSISALENGNKACVCAVCGTLPTVQHVRRGMDITKFTVLDQSGTLQIIYFNNKYIAAQFREGRSYLFYGLVQRDHRHLQMISPSFEPVDGEHPQGHIVPLYSLTAGISQRDLIRITDTALDAINSEKIPDPLPAFLRQQYGFSELNTCLQQIHRPKTAKEVGNARKRLIFEELFLLCCGLARLRERRQSAAGVVMQNQNMAVFWEALGFSPTAAQLRVVHEVVRDCTSGHPMNRLVQGDVGSGKTMIAAAFCILAAQNGYQSAFMAPTEILAAQHFETLSPLLSRCGYRCILLTGGMSAKAKRDALTDISSGMAQVIIGTHALIQKNVNFKNLGAVVVDEQHRFGVHQRAMLSAKGASPHVLVMSATPIPRTLALILYGDLDVSVLDELPPGRQQIASFAVGESMRNRIEKFIEKQCALGGQVYVVCPLLEMGELDLKSAEQHAESLKQALPNRRIGLLHGRMKSTQKDAVMTAFAAGDIDVLVATTVIEVGVNVPNATLIVIEDADRFGLSQLHQLRGRVGRGTRQSYCIFFGADKGAKAHERLRLLCKTADGFEISKADLALRGPGDFFGSRQHGLPSLHIANLVSDMALLQSAQAEAAALLAADPMLVQYPELSARIERLWRTESQDDV